MPQSAGTPSVSVLVPVVDKASQIETSPVKRRGWDRCAEVDAGPYDAAPVR